MTFSPGTPIQAVIATLTTARSLSEVAAEYGVDQPTLEEWGRQTLASLGKVFAPDPTRPLPPPASSAGDAAWAIANNASCGLALLDARGYCIYSNPALLSLTGYTTGELAARPLHDVLHCRGSEDCACKGGGCDIAVAIREHRYLRGHEGRVFRKDGTCFLAAHSTTPILCSSAGATLIELRDISGMHAAQAALRRSEAQFRAIADNIPQLTWIADSSGAVRWYNSRWYAYTGTTEEEMADRGWEKVHHPEHVEMVKHRFQEAVASGHPWEDIFPLRGRDGEYRWFLSRAVPIPADDGVTTLWFGTNTDITEQRDIEEALREADRQKTEFLGVLAHELRNPLAPIRTGLDMFDMIRVDDPLLEEAREIMDRQLNHMSHLIDDLLDVARIERGRMPLRKESCDLAQLVWQTAEDYRPSLDARQVSLHVDVMRGTLHVHGDKVRIVQIIGNLLSNAAKFTQPDGNVHVSLQEQRTLSGATAVIEIRDDGCGIDAHLQRHLFQPFAQAKQDLDRSQGGLGLGLAITKSLVELHGGTIEATSAGTGAGSTFTIRLPVVADIPSSAAQGRRKRSRTPLHILLIDDNLDFLKMLRMTLNVSGHDVAVAVSGTEGLQLAQMLEPDLILCDIGLPGGMDGYKTARALRAIPALANRMIVAVSGYGQERDQEKSHAAGFDAHLVKPVKMAQIFDVLEAAAKRKHQMQPSVVQLARQDDAADAN